MFSYRKRHIKNKIHKIKPKKSIFKRLWFWIFLLVLILFFSSAYFVLFYPGIQIKNIIISGNDKTKTQDIQDIVSGWSTTGLVNFLNFNITSKSIFLVDTNKLDKEILKKFPIIEALKISKEYPQTVTLGVTERKPAGVYCSGSTDNQKCFFIDENGIAYEQLNLLPGEFVVVRQAVDNGQIFTGKEVVAQDIINVISSIQKSLKDNFNINLKEAFVSSPARLNIKTNENWQIYFDLTSSTNIASQITKLNLLLNGKISPDDRKNLRYIDLRPKDRAIICDNKICGG